MERLSLVVFTLSIVTVVHGQCHQDWHYYEGSCYALGETVFSWPDAEDMCQSYNAKLVEIETPEENKWLKSMARTKGGDFYWIGGSDVFHEGVFTWVSKGETIYSFTDWGPGQPNGSGGQDCMMLTKVMDYAWNDAMCSHLHYFICEASPVDVEIG